ncbi:hypothetical protein BDE02_08G201100 [Populus trichocarpa]|nr:hypothetical protein BDE02_08G201100 [Populus trichocarpa]
MWVKLSNNMVASVLCRQEEESHSHLFFMCGWPCRLWAMIKSWLRMDNNMRTLHNALRGLHPKKKSMEARMRRVLLGIVVYLIWEERNQRVFERKTRGVNITFKRLQVLFYIIFHFHEKDHSLLHVG